MPEPTLAEPEPVAAEAATAEPTLAEREVLALQTLERLAAERAKAESEVDRAAKARREEEERVATTHRNRVTNQARNDTTETKAKYQAVKDKIAADALSQTKATEAEYAEAKTLVTKRANSARNTAKKKMEEVRWQALAVFEAGKDNSIKQFKAHEAEIKGLVEQTDDFKFRAEPVLQRVRRFAPPVVPPTPPAVVAAPVVEGAAPDAPAPAEAPVTEPAPGDTPEKPIEALQAALAKAEELLEPVAKLSVPKLVVPLTVVAVLLVGASAYPLGLALGWKVGGGVAAALAAVAGAAAYIGLGKAARGQVARVYPPLLATLAEAERLVDVCKKWAKTTYDKNKDEVEAKRQREVGKAEEKFNQAVAEADEKRAQGTKEADAKYPPLLQAAADAPGRRDSRQADEVITRKSAERHPGPLPSARPRRGRGRTTRRSRGGHRPKAYADAWDVARMARWREGLAGVDAVASIRPRRGRPPVHGLARGRRRLVGRPRSEVPQRDAVRDPLAGPGGRPPGPPRRTPGSSAQGPTRSRNLPAFHLRSPRRGPS